MNMYSNRNINSIGNHSEIVKSLSLLMALSIVVFMSIGYVQAKSSSYKETDIKAALIYNFLKFVDWPEETFQDDEKKNVREAIRIGVVGKEAFDSALKIFRGKKVQGRDLKVILVSDKDLKDDKKLKGFHVLFVSVSAKDEATKMPSRFKNSAVLTIGEVSGFLEAGGIFNFVVEKKKVRFEVNLIAAEEAKIKIRSKLLSLAKRVIKPKPKEERGSQKTQWENDRRVVWADRREAL